MIECILRAQQETQKAALRYERAVSMHAAAREMVHVAEQGLMADRNTMDPTWQEMLNHATSKEHKSRVLLLEERVSKVKTHYSIALRNLEQISEQIHAQRGRGLEGEPWAQTIASDLEKCDSVEHLGDLSDAFSLSGEEGGEGAGTETGNVEMGGARRDSVGISAVKVLQRFLKQHHRSVSM
ncbi:hypothetical protein GJAV_G00105750 [Gymnothorax javanicus]|nr:hypothetical protein GJAV_G00105750 [Gymnothorax javanicus]